MQKLIKTLLVLALLSPAFYACNEDETAAVKEQPTVSEEVLYQIKKLGFSTENVIKEGSGYIVEGDILLSEKELQEAYFEEALLLRIAEVEHYRTTNLVSVSGTTRTLRVAMTVNLPSSYSTALNTAIARYNNENLRVRFTRVSAYPVDILFDSAPSGVSYLASAGFPSGGNPHGTILMNVSAIGTSPNSSYLATIMAHEMGHCIGFRHTDY
ncbi:MAG: M57 family metalloprotease, partial [Bacteroidia bacterium]